MKRRRKGPEASLSAAIVRRAELWGWRVFVIAHTKDAGLRSHTGVGFPDLLMVKDGRAIAAELKVGRRKPTEAQLSWLEALADVPGVEAHLWTDALWHDGTVDEVLLGVQQHPPAILPGEQGGSRNGNTEADGRERAVGDPTRPGGDRHP